MKFPSQVSRISENNFYVSRITAGMPFTVHGFKFFNHVSRIIKTPDHASRETPLPPLYNGFIIQHTDNKTKFEEKILLTSFLFLNSLVKMLKFTSIVGYTSCGPTILDISNEKLRPPLPPIQRWEIWRASVFARIHH